MKPANVCKHLRTKKMYVPAQADELFSPSGEPLDYACNCWCNQTLTEVGRDDRPVGMQLCNRSRPCFEE